MGLKQCGTALSVSIVLLVTLALPTASFAEPITVGIWSLAPSPTNDGIPFYHGQSWDCALCGVAWRLDRASEYLHAPQDSARPVPFYWENWAGGVDLGGTSAYLADHRFSYDGREFFLDNGHGYIARSGDGTSTLLVRLVGPQAVRYWLWFEDLPLRATDSDYQDRGFTWDVSIPPLPLPSPPPPPVPEPATWLLLATGIAEIGRRGWRSALRYGAPESRDRDNEQAD